MSIQGIFSSRSDIQNIKFIDYFVTVGSSNTERQTTVTLNKHILLGKYPTYKQAIEAVEGALVRVGSPEPRTRRIKLTNDKCVRNRGATFTPTGGIVWGSSITTTKSTSSWGRQVNTAAISGMNIPLLIRLEATAGFQIWVKTKSTGGSTGETTASPSSTGYTKQEPNGLFYIPVGQFMHIKMDHDSPPTTGSKAGELKIYNAYTEGVSELDRITLTINA